MSRKLLNTLSRGLIVIEQIKKRISSKVSKYYSGGGKIPTEYLTRTGPRIETTINCTHCGSEWTLTVPEILLVIENTTHDSCGNELENILLTWDDVDVEVGSVEDEPKLEKTSGSYRI
ncbi:hypothetical protein [Halovenus sp. HT40]|uniref:hypothetical protein n=1 Tax=Halovenus sp. HT40 TaxID=3126691 RepID=UPI00300F63AB